MAGLPAPKLFPVLAPLILIPSLLYLALNYMVSSPCLRALPLRMSHPCPASPALLSSMVFLGTWLKAPVSSHHQSHLHAVSIKQESCTSYCHFLSTRYYWITVKCPDTVIPLGTSKNELEKIPGLEELIFQIWPGGGGGGVGGWDWGG